MVADCQTCSFRKEGTWPTAQRVNVIMFYCLHLFKQVFNIVCTQVCYYQDRSNIWSYVQHVPSISDHCTRVSTPSGRRRSAKGTYRARLWPIIWRSSILRSLLALGKLLIWDCNTIWPNWTSCFLLTCKRFAIIQLDRVCNFDVRFVCPDTVLPRTTHTDLH
jgi:hypothetical protein